VGGPVADRPDSRSTGLKRQRCLAPATQPTPDGGIWPGVPRHARLIGHQAADDAAAADCARLQRTVRPVSGSTAGGLSLWQLAFAKRQRAANEPAVGATSSAGGTPGWRRAARLCVRHADRSAGGSWSIFLTRIRRPRPRSRRSPHPRRVTEQCSGKPGRYPLWSGRHHRGQSVTVLRERQMPRALHDVDRRPSPFAIVRRQCA
jgi:hypothetical protein